MGKVILSVEEYETLSRSAKESNAERLWRVNQHAREIETIKEAHATTLGAHSERIETLNGLVEELKKEAAILKKELAATQNCLENKERTAQEHWNKLIGVLNAARGRLKVKYREDASDCSILTGERGVLKLVPIKRMPK